MSPTAKRNVIFARYGLLPEPITDVVLSRPDNALKPVLSVTQEGGTVTRALSLDAAARLVADLMCASVPEAVRDFSAELEQSGAAVAETRH